MDIVVKDLKYPNFADIYPKQLIKDAYNSKYKINPLGIKVLQNKYREIVFYYKSLFFPKSLVIENQESLSVLEVIVLLKLYKLLIKLINMELMELLLLSRITINLLKKDFWNILV